MATITFDGRSFQLDGRRIWIVSGSMHFQRTPRDEWGDRLWAMRQSGLNTVETPVFWNACEPRQKAWDFDGENDVRAFVELAGSMGLQVILRVGPFVGSGWDLGGLPSWLVRQETVDPRSNSQPFLEAVGKWFTALSQRLKDLQATNGGPIILIQAESDWTCADDDLATAYLGELKRYQREAGLNVPRVNGNNLWAGSEGDIDGWTGDRQMLAIMRQLSVVRPDQPRVVVDFGAKQPPVFGVDRSEPTDPFEVQRRLVEVVAGAGQFNISPFVSGSSPGFWAGRAPTGENRFLASEQDLGAPIDLAGRPGVTHGPISRVCRFAGGFGRLLAHLELTIPPVVVDPDGGAANGWSVTHSPGSQGSAAFVFAADGKPRRSSVRLLLHDGTTIEAATGKQSAYWYIFDYNLSSRARLDATSLCPLAHEGDLLVVFGPAGAAGDVVINGTHLFVTVPKGIKPSVVCHEECTVVVVSEETVDQTFLHDGRVFVGVDGVGRDGEPFLRGRAGTATVVSGDGKTKNLKIGRPEGHATPKSKRATLGGWEAADAMGQVDGSSPRFAKITGPADLADLGVAHGYGWYRATLRVGATKRHKLAAPGSGDRLHTFLDGAASGVLGQGPGGAHDLSVSFKKGERTIVVLADNMGRVSGGSDLHDPKGLCDHLYDVAPLKVGRSSMVDAEPIDLLSFKKPLFWTRKGESTHPLRIVWSFAHRKKTSLQVELPPLEERFLMLINGSPVAFADAHRGIKIVLDENNGLRRGNNEIAVAIAFDRFVDAEEGVALVKELSGPFTHGAIFTELVKDITGKASWAFCKWEPPAESFFGPVAKTRLGERDEPTWWRTEFDAVVRPDAPAFIELSGMTKGQIFLNGFDLGRYWVATPDGKAVPPTERIYLPSSWLIAHGNELLIFDEHGGNPGRVKVVYDE